jgi:hypothetical protein
VLVGTAEVCYSSAARLMLIARWLVTPVASMGSASVHSLLFVFG